MRKFTFILILSLCAVCALFAWRRFDPAHYTGNPALKRVGQYARVASGPDPVILRLGGGPDSQIILPELRSEDSTLIRIDSRGWRLAPGLVGEVAGKSGAGLEGKEVRLPARFSLRRGKSKQEIQLADAIRADIQKEHSDETEGVWLVPGARVAAGSGSSIEAGANGAYLNLMASGKFLRISRHQRGSMGKTSVTWADVSSRQTPVSLTLDGTHELIWPGSARYLPAVNAVIRVGTGVTGRKVYIASTDPATELGGLMPDDAGIASGTLDDDAMYGKQNLRVAQYRLTEAANAVRLVALYHVQEPARWWDFVHGEPFQTWTDPAIYNPYAAVPLTACASSDQKTVLWIVPEKTAREISGSTNDAKGAIKPVFPAAWVPEASRGQSAQFCVERSSVQIKGLSSEGKPIPPPLDAVRPFSGRAPQLPSGQTTLQLRTGDQIFLAGQIFLVGGAESARPVNQMAGLTPLVFLLAAMPIAWLLSARIIRQFSALWQTVAPGKFLRGLLILAPAGALAAIVGMLTIGAYYQLRLATEKELAGNPHYFNVFLTSGVDALAAAVIIGAILEYGFNSRGVGQALGLAGISAGLGSGLLLGAEPFLRATAYSHPITGAPWSTFFSDPARMLIPGAILAAGALFLFASMRDVRKDSIPGVLRRLGDRCGKMRQGFANSYHEHYAGRESFFSCMRYYLAWGLFPLATARLICLRKRQPLEPFRKLMTDARILFRVGVPEDRQRLAFFRRLVKYSWTLLQVVGLALAPLLLVYSLSRFTKEAVPPVIVLWAAWVLGRISYWAQSDQSATPVIGGGGWFQTAIIVVCALLFAGGMLILPWLFKKIYEPVWVVSSAFGLLMLGSAMRVVRAWRVPGVLLFHILPFFLILFLTSVVFRDFGAVLVWTWALGWMSAWALALNVLLADPEQGWSVTLGALPCSLLLLWLPMTVLGFFRLVMPYLTQVDAFLRATNRFRLVAAPFYYNSGEWLARVQLIAARVRGVAWVPNLHSDVALNGLANFLSQEKGLYNALMAIVLGLLILAFSDTFRYAASASNYAVAARHLQSAFVSATALFGLGMLIFVHLGASVLDVLPLTGVPCPWLSHALNEHTVMTCLVLGTLMTASESASGGGNQ